MICVKGYYSASIRGPKGNDATDLDIQENTQQGIFRGGELQQRFGSILDLYVPHAHDEAIQWLWRGQHVNIKAILDADCAIIKQRDFMIVDGFHSDGVKVEVACCEEKGIPIIYLKRNMDKSMLEIHTLINSLLRKKING